MSYFLDAARVGLHGSKRAAAVTVAGLEANLALTAPTAPAVAAAGPVTTPSAASDTPALQQDA